MWQELTQSSYTVSPASVYSVSTEIRTSLWWLSWKALSSTNLIWGNGTGATEHVIERTNDRFDIKNTLNTKDPHSQYFETLISHGLLGLSVLLMILVFPACLAWRRGDLLTFCFCILMLITCITESALSVQKGILFFSVLYSLLISPYSES